MGDDIMHMVRAGLAELETNFDAMVIGNQGENFSAGANLMMVLLAAQEQEWDELNAAINAFQQMNMSLKYAPKPVVAAPFGLALGGGCEIPLHCTRDSGVGGTVHGAGGSRRGRDPRGRRLQGDAAALARSQEDFRADRFREGFDERGGSAPVPLSCAMAMASR